VKLLSTYGLLPAYNASGSVNLTYFLIFEILYSKDINKNTILAKKQPKKTLICASAKLSFPILIVVAINPTKAKLGATKIGIFNFVTTYSAKLLIPVLNNNNDILFLSKLFEFNILAISKIDGNDTKKWSIPIVKFPLLKIRCVNNRIFVLIF